MKYYFENIIEERYIPFDDLKNSTIMVTGATGLIGSMTVKALLYINESLKLSMHIIAFVRNEEKAREIYKDEPVGQKETLSFVIGNVIEKINLKEQVNYIIHAAAPTESSFFITHPVDVIETNVIGTKNILNYAKKCKCRSVLFLSSMEVYGFTTEEELLTEDSIKYLNPLEIRSSYPESKRMAENLCISYCAQYNVPIKIVRLAQTFGYGVNKNDKRVFMEFAKCALEKRDIVLFTNGKSKRMYLDTIDAVTAILTVLLKGKDGKTYNVANKRTYCSIYDMANVVCEAFSNNDIKVRVEIDEDKSKKYSPTHKFNLDVSEIEKLGWTAKFDLKEMYERLRREMC